MNFKPIELRTKIKTKLTYKYLEKKKKKLVAVPVDYLKRRKIKTNGRQKSVPEEAVQSPPPPTPVGYILLVRTQSASSFPLFPFVFFFLTITNNPLRHYVNLQTLDIHNNYKYNPLFSGFCFAHGDFCWRRCFLHCLG